MIVAVCRAPSGTAFQKVAGKKRKIDISSRGKTQNSVLYCTSMGDDQPLGGGEPIGFDSDLPAPISKRDA